MRDTGAIGALGRLAAAAGIFGDGLTLYEPGLPNPTERTALRGAAGLNATGTTMALLAGVNGVADWVPVAGQVIMVGTGLFLAGDYIYHHRKAIGHFFTSTVPNFVTHTVPHALGDAASGVKKSFTGGVDVSVGPIHFSL